MGESFWILVWSGWSSGLNMRNARFLVQTKCPYEGKSQYPEGYTHCPACGVGKPPHLEFDKDIYGNERNSWAPVKDGETDEEINERLKLEERFGTYWRILR